MLIRTEMRSGRHSDTILRLGVVWMLAAMLTAAQIVAAASSDPSEAEVAGEFQHVCRSMKRSLDIYWGEISRETLESELLQEEDKKSPDPQRVAVLRLNLARELIEFGRTQDALELLGEKHFASFDARHGATRDTTRNVSSATTDMPAEHAEHETKPSASASSSGSNAAAESEIHSAWLMLRLEAHLRQAEDQNCFLNHAATSCILPFDEAAVHRRPDPARRAASVALKILDRDPEDFVARWLLNLMRMATHDHPKDVPESYRLPEDALKSPANTPRWHNRALALGLSEFDLAGGAIMDDFDGDGLLDLVSSTADPCDNLKAYRNDGKGGFTEVTEIWGLSNQLGGLNVVHTDYDGDGALDLLVLRGAWQHEFGKIRNSLLHNELAGPAGRFVDVTHSSGLADHDYPTQTAAWADYDLDGDLDLYIGNEAFGPRRFPSQLFRNNGKGYFFDVTEEAGVANLSMAKGVAWGDFDNDGDPDLYVSNIGPNRLYRNDGNGRFTDVAAELGVVDPFRRSFATWFFDYDNDGRLDLFVANYDTQIRNVAASYFGKRLRTGHPLLYHNDGATFRKVSKAVGLTRPLMPMGANYGDIDNDGWLDLYLGTGEPSYLALLPNVMLRNEQGVHFFDVTFAAGVGHLQKGHGVAFGDLDNDGDQDLFHQLGGFYPGDRFSNALFENPGNENSWITLRLAGSGANRFGVGARIEVRIAGATGARSIHLLAGSGGSFGGSSMQQEIGLGDATRIEELRIRWPGSQIAQIHRDVAINHFYRAVEGQADLIAEDRPQLRLRNFRAKPHKHDP